VSPTGPMSRRQALGTLGALALPLAFPAPASASAALPGDPNAAPTQAIPDLGNLHGAIEWIARENAPSLSFLDPRWKSLAAWKRAARPALLRALAFDPPRGPVRSEVVAREVRQGFTLETVRIRATPAYDIPARVLVPTGRRGRLPAVVALHSHGGEYQWGSRKLVSSPDDPPALVDYRERLYGGRALADELARRGFVVIAIDAFYFGERRLRPETQDAAAVPADGREAFRSLATLAEGSKERHVTLNRVAGSFEPVVAKTLLAAGATWPGIIAWDDRRSVDYLASRPEVDPERIGCIGLSGGGLRAALLGAADPRVKAACVTAWMTEWAPMLAKHARRHTWMAYAPLRGALDLPDAAALVAPGALLVQQAARDTLFPMDGMRGAVEKLERTYAKAGIRERFRGTFHDAPHSFTPAMQEEAFAWLERWL